jgi:hypothetical protein
MSPEERINRRIEKFGKMGFWEELPEQNQNIPEVKLNENLG